MATETEQAPGFPDYMLDPDAVMKDDAKWRLHAPDYTTTRKIWAESKSANHAPNSLESLVENLVKNWEVEASHKKDIAEWRTIDPDVYTFAINGGPPQDASHMLKVGTYNAIIAPNQFYAADGNDFEKSHTVFRDMMPNFAWEVLEVYSGPPVVAFKWRHWGWMRGDYVGVNDKGHTVTIKAHNNLLDIQGITVAKLNDKFKVTSLETWFDPVEMFNQMKPSPESMTIVELMKTEEAVAGKGPGDPAHLVGKATTVPLETGEEGAASTAGGCPMGFSLPKR